MCKFNQCVKNRCRYAHSEEQIVNKQIANPYNVNYEYKVFECPLLRNCSRKDCSKFHSFDETRLGILLLNLNKESILDEM